MIRGSIEVAQKTRVAGWVYSPADLVRDKLILAFVGSRCVGAGKVELFRQDLLEAQLGDGYCGFDFPINLEDGEPLGGVVVKLQHSDAALIQHSSKLTGPDDDVAGAIPDLGAISPSSVTWMQDRGWLEQHEYDFLKAIQGIGAYERGLRAPRRPGVEAPPVLKPEMVAADLMSIYMLGDVDVVRTQIASISDFAADSSPLRNSGVSVAALWSEEKTRLALDERSHVGPRAGRGLILSEPPPGAIDYSFGPDRLLFLHKDCAFAPRGFAPSSGITVFTATVRAAIRGSGRAMDAGAKHFAA